MLTLLWSLTAGAQEEGRDDKGGYLMNDVGAWLYLPDNMENGLEWSDWDFKAKTTDGAVQMKVWLTPFQVDVSLEALQDYGQDYMRRVGTIGGSDPKITRAELTDWGDKPGGRVDVAFSFQEGRVKGYAYHAVIPSAGQMLHIRTIAAGRNARRAVQALEQIGTGLKREKKPFDVAMGGPVQSESGFAATLPAGWRVPTDPEIPAVLKKGELVGVKDLSKCWTAIRPPAMGEPDLMLACKKHHYLGPVDEHSWKGEEADVRDTLFGQTEVPKGEQLQVGDRTGFYYKPKGGDQALRLAVAPFDGGLMTVWGISGQIGEGGLDEAMKTVSSNVTFTNDGGKPIISADKWLGYYLRYRTFSPIVLGPLLLLVGAIVGGVVMMNKRSASKYDDI